MGIELTAAQIWDRLPLRKSESNKGTYGRVTLVSGSLCYRGAAALCAEGAARAGAGIVTLASVEPVLAAVIPRLPEICLLPCAGSAEGGICAEEAGKITEKANAGSVLALGPGLGDTEETQRLVTALVQASTVPVVLDADGLNAAAKCGELPRPDADAPLILTPHPGEMARLAGVSVEDVQGSRESVAVGYARANDCVVVLKGHRTVLAGPDGTVYVNPTGNAGLSRGGSGDILTGMLAAFLAQGLGPLDAAACAVWLHGAAADGAARRLGQTGMLPHDIFYDLGRLFSESGR